MIQFFYNNLLKFLISRFFRLKASQAIILITCKNISLIIIIYIILIIFVVVVVIII